MTGMTLIRSTGLPKEKSAAGETFERLFMSGFVGSLRTINFSCTVQVYKQGQPVKFLKAVNL